MKKILLVNLLLILSYSAKSQNFTTLPTKEARWLRDQAVLVPELKRDIVDLNDVIKDKNSTIHTHEVSLQQCADRDARHQSIVQSKTKEFQAKELGHLAETTALNKQIKKQKRRKTFWKIVSGTLTAAFGYLALK